MLRTAPSPDPTPPGRGISAERRDRIQPVDRQLTQTLKVRALAAQALEQERRVRDRELVPAVRSGHRDLRSTGQFSELLSHPARQVPDAAAEASTQTRVNRPQTRPRAPRPTTRTGRSRSPAPATSPRSGARRPRSRAGARACATSRRRTVAAPYSDRQRRIARRTASRVSASSGGARVAAPCSARTRRPCRCGPGSARRSRGTPPGSEP